MATKPSEPNKFIALKKCIAGLHKDIAFLKKCIDHRITPTSHRIRTKTYTEPRVIRRMEAELIKESIKTLYSKLNGKTLECYSLHLKLAKDFPLEFPTFLMKVKIAEQCESERKRKLHNSKFHQLVASTGITKATKPVVQNLEEFVVNRSSQTFSDEQLTLLNKGLNYAITPKANTEKLIIDVETAINNNNLSLPQINSARQETARIIRKGNSTQYNNNEPRLTKELKEKPVFYLKADKGNRVVIMDKTDYDRQMTEKLNDGPFRKQRNDPLPEMVKCVNKTLKECESVLGNVTNKLKVSNPILPRIKGLPKIHKPGNEMREIISAVGSPTHKIAKWLVKEFQDMPLQFQSRSVNSTLQFTQHLQTQNTLSEDEVMVSFDVKALFPSVPVKEAINLLEDWLHSQHTNSTWKAKVRTYIKLTRLCMEQNYFAFRGDFYKQTKGAPMGNPLAPFLSEIFMANLEQQLQEKNLLPERWWRYVDDVFCIIKRDSLAAVLDAINKSHKNIQFTYEMEIDGKLPFLDILIVREPIPFSSSSSLTFEIYRKPTNTRRTIPSSSNHSYQHKMAAFHHMVHRMNTLPLSAEGKSKELEYIFETASLNGYQRNTIQKIVDKKKRDEHKRTLTTLTPTTEPLKRVAVDFDHNLARRLRPKLVKFGLDLVYSSRCNQLQSILGQTKDPVENLGKSGIYKISCSHCDKIYIGQTKRTLEIRFKEHLAEVTKARKETDKGKHHNFKSKVAEHIFTEEHPLTTDNITTLRRITNPWKLDTAESLEIYKQKQSTLLNKDQGNGYSWLFKLLPTHTHYNVPLQHSEAD